MTADGESGWKRTTGYWSSIVTRGATLPACSKGLPLSDARQVSTNFETVEYEGVEPRISFHTQNNTALWRGIAKRYIQPAASTY